MQGIQTNERVQTIQTTTAPGTLFPVTETVQTVETSTGPVTLAPPNNLYGQQQRPTLAANAYFDIPADKRLRPWIIIGSILLACLGVAMIITPLVSHGHLSVVWAIFISGIALTVASIFGLLAGFTLRPIFAALFFFVLAAAFAGSIVLLIINACVLNHNLNNRCANVNAPHFSAACGNIRDYHNIIYSVFGPLVVIWVPTLLVAAAYLWRTTSIYRKQEYGNSTLPQTSGTVARVGAPTM